MNLITYLTSKFLREHRKHFLNVLVLFLLIVFSGQAVVFVSSYFTDNMKNTNLIPVEDNQSEILETFEIPADISPGDKIEKRVTVQNTSGVICYVRAKVRFSDSSVLDFMETDLPASEYWVYDESDGYYYYIEEVNEGAVTSPLMTSVTILSSATQEELDKAGNFLIYIESESCQKGETNTYTEAWANMYVNR